MGALLAATVALLSLAATAVLFELGARQWLRLAARTYPAKPRTSITMLHNREHLPQLAPTTTFSTNALGLRGRDAPPGGRVYRVLMCGGSAVECYALDDGEAWPHLVERALAAPAARARLAVDDVHVQVLARSGFTTESLGYLLPRVCDRVGMVDVLTITSGVSLLNAWTLAGAPAVPMALVPAWDDVDWHAEHAWGWSPKRTATAEIVRRLRHGLVPAPVVQSGTGGGLAAARRARADAAEMRETTPDPSLWIDHYETALGHLIPDAQRRARRVVLLRQPWFDVAEPTPDETRQFWHGFAFETAPDKRRIFFSHRVLCDMMGRIDAATVRAARRHGVETMRLADALVPSTAVFYDFMHLTPLGARQIADLVARRLLELETGDETGDEVGDGHVAEPLGAKSRRHG